MLASVASAQSSLLVDESLLPAYMLDQKDPLFYREGVIATTSGTSSLCGPTSVMNWLQLRHQNAYSKIQLVHFVQVIGQDLRAQGIEINNGLTEGQLLNFLEIYNSYLEERSGYVLRGRSEISPIDILNSKPQLLMLRYTERPHFTPGPIRRDNFQVPISGAHWVLKVGANPASSELFVIDPENPGRLTRLALEGNTIRPQSKADLETFAFGRALIWSLTSLIEEN